MTQRPEEMIPAGEGISIVRGDTIRSITEKFDIARWRIIQERNKGIQIVNVNRKLQRIM